MQKIVSVVTAVDPDRADYLPETYESLRQQEMPNGWEWEWLVQCDGLDSSKQEHVKSLLPTHEPRLRYEASRQGGPGIARTMTLHRAEGRLVKTLDADDRLTSGALARDIAALSQHGVQWAASRVEDDWDGERTPHYPYDPPHGRVVSGTVYKRYRTEDYRILVHPATLCMSFALLAALGGWMALPASEDTALLLALDAVSDGFFTSEVGMVYRRWPPQMSASSEHADPDELATRRRLALLRAECLHDLIGGY